MSHLLGRGLVCLPDGKEADDQVESGQRQAEGEEQPQRAQPPASLRSPHHIIMNKTRILKDKQMRKVKMINSHTESSIPLMPTTR